MKRKPCPWQWEYFTSKGTRASAPAQLFNAECQETFGAEHADFLRENFHTLRQMFSVFETFVSSNVSDIGEAAEEQRIKDSQALTFIHGAMGSAAWAVAAMQQDWCVMALGITMPNTLWYMRQGTVIGNNVDSRHVPADWINRMGAAVFGVNGTQDQWFKFNPGAVK